MMLERDNIEVGVEVESSTIFLTSTVNSPSDGVVSESTKLSKEELKQIIDDLTKIYEGL